MVIGDPVFCDFEASSAFGGFPIEVGWAFVSRDGQSIILEGHLINPAPEWAHAHWDDDAEQLHGISRTALVEWGEWPEAVARRMNAALDSRHLFSDSPFDEHWLRQLFDATGITPTFEVRRTSAEVLARQFADEHSIPTAILSRALIHANRAYPQIHRAALDASHWAAVWQFLLRNAP